MDRIYDVVKALSDDQMYDIVSKRDARFDGVFFFGAYDSEVYCLPSCKARTPLRRKIRYYNTRQEAESLSYRPCRRCHPDLILMKNLDTI